MRAALVATVILVGSCSIDRGRLDALRCETGADCTDERAPLCCEGTCVAECDSGAESESESEAEAEAESEAESESEGE